LPKFRQLVSIWRRLRQVKVLVLAYLGDDERSKSLEVGVSASTRFVSS
jgi:hypothetical protein